MFFKIFYFLKVFFIETEKNIIENAIKQIILKIKPKLILLLLLKFDLVLV